MKSDPAAISSPSEVDDGVWVIRNRVFASNTYICKTSQAGGCVVIDPGLDQEATMLGLEQLRLSPIAVVCTHGHFDHIGSASAIQAQYGAVSVYLHSDDLKLARSANFLLMLAKLEIRIVTPAFHSFEGFRGRLPLGGLDLEFINVPGHTLGSCCLLAKGCAFTGDTLYMNSVDPDGQKQGRGAALASSLRWLWDNLADSTLILPGHGGNGKFSELKLNNSEFRGICGVTAGKVEDVNAGQ